MFFWFSFYILLTFRVVDFCMFRLWDLWDFWMGLLDLAFLTTQNAKGHFLTNENAKSTFRLLILGRGTLLGGPAEPGWPVPSGNPGRAHPATSHRLLGSTVRTPYRQA